MASNLLTITSTEMELIYIMSCSISPNPKLSLAEASIRNEKMLECLFFSYC